MAVDWLATKLPNDKEKGGELTALAAFFHASQGSLLLFDFEGGRNSFTSITGGIPRRNFNLAFFDFFVRDGHAERLGRSGHRGRQSGREGGSIILGQQDLV